MISYENRLGSIELTEEFLGRLIGNEVISCFGVVGMVPSNNRQRLTKIFIKEGSLDTGIKVRGDREKIDVELHIVVTYGMNINAIASSITEKVKYKVKEITGTPVDRVIIKVDGIKE